MTGPDHYLYAESSVKEAFTGEKDVAVVTALLARAQVHATLALTAATAARDLKTRIDWVDVLRDRKDGLS